MPWQDLQHLQGAPAEPTHTGQDLQHLQGAPAEPTHTGQDLQHLGVHLSGSKLVSCLPGQWPK
jgi:hypothetical protein